MASFPTIQSISFSEDEITEKMAAGKTVVVWEWESNDPGVFAPFDEKASNFIEQRKALGTIPLSQLGEKYSAWTVDLKSMIQRSSYFGRERRIRRKLYPNDCLIAYGIVWEFHGGLGWQQFDVNVSSCIEDVYSTGKEDFHLQRISGFPHIIEFTTMTLRNEHSHQACKIRRRQVTSPYIGGSVGPLLKTRKTKSIRAANAFSLRNHSSSDATGNQIVVWEFEIDTPGIFAPYHEDLSNLIEKESKAKQKIVQLDPKNGPLQVNLSSMKQMSGKFGSERKVRRHVYSDDVTIANQIAWEWFLDSHWQQYNVETACLIEECFNKGEAELNLLQTPLGIPNTIYFNSMIQKNQIYGTVRMIRRRAISKSYVAEEIHNSDSSRHYLDEEEEVTIKNKASLRGRTRKLFVERWGSTTQKDDSDDDFEEVKCIEPREDLLASDDSPIPKPRAAYLTKSLEEDQKSQGEIAGDAEVIQTQTYRLREIPILHAALKQFCESCSSVDENEDCSICLDELKNPSSSYGAASGNSVVFLKVCKHKFHEACLEQCYESGNKDGSIQCPICKAICGIKQGIQPPGSMTVTRIPGTIPGYNGCGCIQITYNIQPGIQGPNHPNPGAPYNAFGFPRVAYLPDNDKGKKVLRLLETAWERKLIFTIGSSVTTGAQNTVVWNEIHHKTEAFSNSSGHGYPDPNYLDNVLLELKVQGVF